MKRHLYILTLALGLLGARSASAVSETYVVHGTSCFSTTAGSMPVYTQFGVHAPAGALDVMCPLAPHLFSFTNASIILTGYGRSSVDKVSCSIAGTTFEGGGLLFSTATLPNNSPASQFKSASIGFPATRDRIYLTCHIPGATGSGVSHVTSINVTLTHCRAGGGTWSLATPHNPPGPAPVCALLMADLLLQARMKQG